MMNTSSSLPIWRRCTGFARFVGHRLVVDRCLETAGSLTYTTLLAVVPLFTIALTLISAFPMFSDIGIRFRIFILTNLVPDAAGKVVGVYMRQFADNADKLTAFGMIGLLATALLLMFTIEKTFNGIWRVSKPRKLFSRTLIYWAVLTLAPILIGISLSLTSWISQMAGLNGPLGFQFFKLGPWALVFGSLSLLYLAVPNCFVPRKHALTAAFIISILLELMKSLFALYIRHFANYKLVYGAFASVPIFLLWLYLCWALVLIGAVLSATLSYWHGDGWRWSRHHGTRFEQAVHILTTLAQAHQSGEVLHIDQLRRQVGLGVDATQQILEILSSRKWVESTRDGEWVLACNTSQITLKEVFELIVSPLSSAYAMNSALTSLMHQTGTTLDITLSALMVPQQPSDASNSQATATA